SPLLPKLPPKTYKRE
nr:Chain B, SOS-A PEPTIDE [Mus musculus]